VVVCDGAVEVVGCGQGDIFSGSWGVVVKVTFLVEVGGSWVVVVAGPQWFCSWHSGCILFSCHSGRGNGGFAALFLVGLVVVAVVKQWVFVWWCLLLLVVLWLRERESERQLQKLEKE